MEPEELLGKGEYVSAAEAARILEVTLMAVRNAVADGRLPASHVLGRIVIKITDLDAYRARTRGPNGEKPRGRPLKDPDWQ